MQKLYGGPEGVLLHRVMLLESHYSFQVRLRKVIGEMKVILLFQRGLPKVLIKG